jgi:hypothetical protein
MNLSADTLAILKNFAGINSNIVLKPGSVIKTMAEAKNVLAKATVAETFPDQDVGIYDLNEFLSVTGMFTAPEFRFSDDMNSVAIVEGKRSVKYFFSDTSILTFPTKDIVMPKPEVTFTLSQDEMNALRKAASALGVTDVVIFGEEGSDQAFVKVSDVKDATSNSFKIELEGVTRRADPFSFVFNIGNFKLISGDYVVSVSSKLISHFKHQSMDLEYWIALEKNSTYGS